MNTSDYQAPVAGLGMTVTLEEFAATKAPKKRRFCRTTDEYKRSVDYCGEFYGNFCMPTAGFLIEASYLMGKNDLLLYLGIGIFYNVAQERAYPKPIHLDAVIEGMDRHEKSKAMKRLEMMGRIERWKQPAPYKNIERWWKFYRMPFVNKEGHQVATRQQYSARELLALKADRKIPVGYEWLRQAELLTPPRNLPDEN